MRYIAIAAQEDSRLIPVVMILIEMSPTAVPATEVITPQTVKGAMILR